MDNINHNHRGWVIDHLQKRLEIFTNEKRVRYKRLSWSKKDREAVLKLLLIIETEIQSEDIDETKQCDICKCSNPFHFSWCKRY